SRLFLVAFGEIQQRVVLAVAPPLRVGIYRRLMMRIAEAIARRNRAQALGTGEVVGQGASQPPGHMPATDRVVGMPVLRPLVGMDKDEVSAQAARLGTYPVSVVPDQECGTLFTPRHPATRARLLDVERAEAALPMDELVERAVAEAQLEEFHFPTNALV